MTSFHFEKRAEGGCRVICFLGTGAADRNRRVEACASTQAEAVRLALRQAEEGNER